MSKRKKKLTICFACKSDCFFFSKCISLAKFKMQSRLYIKTSGSVTHNKCVIDSLWEGWRFLSAEQRVYFVLEELPLSSVMDTNDSIDLNARDVVRFIIPCTETGQQEIITWCEPERGRRKKYRSEILHNVYLYEKSRMHTCGTKVRRCFPPQSECSPWFPAPKAGSAPSYPFYLRPKTHLAGDMLLPWDKTKQKTDMQDQTIIMYIGLVYKNAHSLLQVPLPESQSVFKSIQFVLQSLLMGGVITKVRGQVFMFSCLLTNRLHMGQLTLHLLTKGEHVCYINVLQNNLPNLSPEVEYGIIW